ncbi:hypothetical protein DFJ43DRAFT_1004899 [Lentinula guzmanii]|uniref:Uncharacterized protein n=1 Tax=Lentinula guzmanii TaxID=2804957 RepID=A0AA38J9L0_9AGAR|nr:hypothetical protein DFJ43DRAFT_1004899 [Lentinula guzmanii]
MSITFQTGILFSLAFILSFRFNRRRTEDSTHPLWSLILYKLCGPNLGRLLPTPQFRLYISPESSNPNETLSGAVLEVIPDFCILLYRAQPVKPKTFLAQILQQITTSFLPSPHTVQISSLSIPLLVELKRPISRNCVDLKEFMSGLTSSMLKARNQVTAQALCLFSIPEHHDQDGVFLIAAVGEWWSFRLVSRSDFEGRIFQDHLYDKLLQVKENEKEDNEDMTHLMGSSQTGDMEKYQAQMKEETPEEIRLRHKRERANRLSEREKTRIDWSQNQSDLQKLIDEAEVKMGEPGVYANEKMDEYSRLQSTLDRSWQRHWGTVFLEPDPASRSGLVDIKQQTEWSKVFRIGTQTSASYLDQISNELARLVEQTSLEDLPVADPSM